jgi:hypothetical protein
MRKKREENECARFTETGSGHACSSKRSESIGGCVRASRNIYIQLASCAQARAREKERDEKRRLRASSGLQQA